MREHNRWHGCVSKGLFCIGIGGLLTYYIVEWSQIKLPVISEMIEEWILLGQMKNLQIGLFEMVIFAVSIFMLLLSALLGNWELRTGIKIFILFLLAFLNFGGIITVIGRGEIFPLYILTIWLTATYIIWISIGVIKMIYSWCKIRETDERFNVAKLTLIWTVTAFILGKLL